MNVYEVDWDAGTENAYEDWRDRVTAEAEDFQAPGTSLPSLASAPTAGLDAFAASQDTNEEAAA